MYLFHYFHPKPMNWFTVSLTELILLHTSQPRKSFGSDRVTSGTITTPNIQPLCLCGIKYFLLFLALIYSLNVCVNWIRNALILLEDLRMVKNLEKYEQITLLLLSNMLQTRFSVFFSLTGRINPLAIQN